MCQLRYYAQNRRTYGKFTKKNLQSDCAVPSHAAFFCYNWLVRKRCHRHFCESGNDSREREKNNCPRIQYGIS